MSLLLTANSILSVSGMQLAVGGHFELTAYCPLLTAYCPSGFCLPGSGEGGNSRTLDEAAVGVGYLS